MKDTILDQYQNNVNESLIRHKSILDILSKLMTTEATLQRAVCHSVTSCGCIEINAAKQIYYYDNSNTELLANKISNHLSGNLCPKCRETIESELGNNIFYLTCLCNLLDINLYDILINENKNILTLGKFTLK